MSQPVTSRNRKCKHPWREIEQAFVLGTDTIEATAQHYGISPAVMRRYAGTNRWYDKRAEHVADMQAKAMKAAERHTILEKAGFDALCENTCDVAVALINRELVRLFQSEGMPDPAELKEALTAVEKAQNIKYRSLGIAPPKQVIENIVSRPPGEITRDELLAELAAFNEPPLSEPPREPAQA